LLIRGLLEADKELLQGSSKVDDRVVPRQDAMSRPRSHFIMGCGSAPGDQKSRASSNVVPFALQSLKACLVGRNAGYISSVSDGCLVGGHYQGHIMADGPELLDRKSNELRCRHVKLGSGGLKFQSGLARGSTVQFESAYCVGGLE
jgi:hypothetical protein